jgi:hypothetical protein
MAFFKIFPKIGYDLKNTGVLQNVVNIYRSVRPLREFVDDISAYKLYEIKNGERPDIVSQRLYGTPDYYWTFFIVNEYLHDGLASWPMSQEDLFNYMKTEYNGFAITTRPVVIRNTDQLVTDFQNSLAGRFTLGETITGSSSLATGTLTKKNIDMNQLIVQDCTGAFQGDPNSVPNLVEVVTGSQSEDSVDTYEVFKYIDAPYSYYTEGDPEKRIQHNGVFVEGNEPSSDLKYITNRAHLEESNDERSRMRVIAPEYITQFVDKFEELINNN